MLVSLAMSHPNRRVVAMNALDRFSEATQTWFSASFGAPTAAQSQAWDAVAEDRNALVVAPTGSGKTLSAFLWSIDRLFAEQSQKRHRPDEQQQSTAQKTSSAQSPVDTADAGPATRVLYISPLKALGTDIERNLRSPLIGIGHTARRLGEEPGEITVGIRTGDSTSKQRRDLQRNPPHILITTPESLYLMLTSAARQTLVNVETVIVDEVHALAGTKRGAHLAVSLERLDALREQHQGQRSSDTGVSETRARRAQRIGLSATVEPHDEVARFLGGSQPVEVVAPATEKQWDITVSVPVDDMAAPTGELPGSDADQPLTPSIWPHVEHRVVDLVQANRSTIVFTNSRRLAEKLTGRINEIWGERSADSEESPTLARAHHGSVSKEQRAFIEDDLKTGRLRCVVATSSLELGIDMGAVDLVIQVEAPPAVSAGLQRIGRAGHQVGEVSAGWFFPKHRGDLLSAAVVVERMLAGRIEALSIPSNPLDILAQQTIAAAALETLDVEEWFETLRRSAAFATLPRSAYESTLDLLAGKYPSDRFADLRPRIIWDRDAGTITGRPGAQRLAVTSGGTIPDRGLFGVYLVGAEDSRTGGRRVGELDEEMVYESRVGDVFALGATSWRIEEITFDRVMVSPAFGQPATLPFWRGDGLGRPAELGEALGAFTREMYQAADHRAAERMHALGMDERAQQNLRRYLSEQHDATGTVPSDTTLIVEQTRDELGDWRIILHSPYGMQVHAPWALAIGERLHERYGLDGAAFASDDGIVLRVPMMDDEPPGAELFRFDPDELEDLVVKQVSSSALFAGRFREAAARSLLLPRQNPGQRTPLWQQRQRSSQLLEVAHEYPDFPVIMEAMREVLQDVYDLPALHALTRRIEARQVKLTEATTQTPSPFAQSILFGYIAQYLYEGDSPLAERRAAALSVDPHVLNELLGRVELREFLDPDVIAEAEAHAQYLSPHRRLSGAEGAADLLRLLGPLSSGQLAQRLQGSEPASSNAEGSSGDGTTSEGDISTTARAAEDSPTHVTTSEAEAWAEHLVSVQRAIRISWQGELRYASVEDAARLRDGLGINIPVGVPQTFLDPVDDPIGDIISRFARTHRPFTAAEAAESLGLPTGIVSDLLRRLVEENRVVEGLFSPHRGGHDPEYVEIQMLRRIRRRSLAALRAAVEPVPTRAFAQFLAEWQSVTGQQLEEAAGVAEVITQLAGYPAPASAWESYILPARISGYRPGMLDELITSGEVLIVGCGALTGYDGWIALAPADDAELLSASSTAEASPPSELAARILDVLSSGGAWFPDAISAQLEGITADDAREALWDLFWAGHVHPDSFAPLRSRLQGGSTAHRTSRRPTRRRTASRRMALRESVRAARGDTPSSVGSSAGSGGRWALVPDMASSPTELAHARAEVLLDRYGVLTRGSVVAEQTPGGFSGVYKVLAAAEEAGRIRRGYFIEQLGAAQFTTSATIDRLREINDALEEGRRGEPYALAAADPANPFGAALDWPAPVEPSSAEAGGTGASLAQVNARPGRKAGAVVVISGGQLLVYMERGGRTMLIFTENNEVLDQAAHALVARLESAGSPRLAVERINGEAALNHRFADSLKTAGFHSAPSGLRFSPRGV